MEEKDEKYLNIRLKNEHTEEEPVVSIIGIIKKLKKYFLIWVVVAVVAAALTLTDAVLSVHNYEDKTLTALVSFTHAGIEEGLDPQGKQFDVYTLKSPAVIEMALTELGYEKSDLELIRQGIDIHGILPEDAIDRITAYKSIYENGSSAGLAAAQAMLEESYYPTQYTVSFDYSETPYDNAEAVQLFNTMLDCYRTYFFETYGYNEALGSAVTAINYEDYDYAEAVDVFDSTLLTLKNYVNALAKEDTTRFRSNATGYTFADLAEAINTIQEMDLDLLSSYVTVNNVTRDKDTLITYYQYRIETYTRQSVIAEEKLASIVESINAYQKDTIMFMGGEEQNATQHTQASEQYDALIQQKIDTQTSLSTAKQQIVYYTQRIEALRTGPTGSARKVERVEKDLAALNVKVNDLIDTVNKTADEYYENGTLANAYNVLVPASITQKTAQNTLSQAISNSFTTLFVIEAVILVLYICVAFVTAIVAENKKLFAGNGSKKSENEADEDPTEQAVELKKEEKADNKAKSKK